MFPQRSPFISIIIYFLFISLCFESHADVNSRVYWEKTVVPIARDRACELAKSGELSANYDIYWHAIKTHLVIKSIVLNKIIGQSICDDLSHSNYKLDFRFENSFTNIQCAQRERSGVLTQAFVSGNPSNLTINICPMGEKLAYDDPSQGAALLLHELYHVATGVIPYIDTEECAAEAYSLLVFSVTENTVLDPVPHPYIIRCGLEGKFQNLIDISNGR